MNAVKEITEELKSMDSVLAELPRTMPYSVPEGYFGQLTQDIRAAVERDARFGVPEGYFEKLPEQMLAAAKRADRKPLLILLAGRIRWVAAAVLIVCIGAGSYMTFQGKPLSAERMLSTVPASEIQDYLQSTDRNFVGTHNNAELGKLQLDNKEIVSYLNEMGWE